MPRLHALSVLICATLLSGQSANLVQNGDFEGGKTTGWSFAGYTIAASVMSFDTTGVGASKGFSNRPGCKASPCKTEYTMQQSVMVIAKVPYLLTADLAVSNTSVLSNVDAGKISFRVDGVLLETVGFGTSVAQTTRRQRICVNFRPGSSGSKLLTGTFSAAGTHTINFPLKNAVGAAGIKVYWQGLQLGTPSNSLGPLEMFGVYR